MLNKKGTSIIELIISIALLSIVLAFMLKLLVDLNNTRTNNTFAKDNQIVRSEIIRTIEKDIKDKTITGISGNASNGTLTITISFTEGDNAIIQASSNELVYTKSSGDVKVRKWTMKDCSIYTSKVYINKYIPYDNTSTSYGFVMNIQIHTINDENNIKKNNPLDDIQISYFSNNYKDEYNNHIPDYLP